MVLTSHFVDMIRELEKKITFHSFSTISYQFYFGCKVDKSVKGLGYQEKNIHHYFREFIY